MREKALVATSSSRMRSVRGLSSISDLLPSRILERASGDQGVQEERSEGGLVGGGIASECSGHGVQHGVQHGVVHGGVIDLRYLMRWVFGVRR